MAAILTKRTIGYTLLIILIIVPAAMLIPGGDEIEAINTLLTITGVLYAIIVGLFITDLWTRYEKIRSNVAIEVSGIITYFSFLKIIADNKKNNDWLDEQAGLIDDYVRKFITVQWHEYEQTDEQFNMIVESAGGIKGLTDDGHKQVYNNMLASLSSVSDAREALIILGKDRLSRTSWLVTIFLSATLIFNLFYINDNSAVMVIFITLLTSVIFFLLMTLKDLNDLQKGEELVSFEPYEKIFDSLEHPRFYRKEDIERGLASNKK